MNEKFKILYENKKKIRNVIIVGSLMGAIILFTKCNADITDEPVIEQDIDDIKEDNVGNVDDSNNNEEINEEKNNNDNSISIIDDEAATIEKEDEDQTKKTNSNDKKSSSVDSSNKSNQNDNANQNSESNQNDKPNTGNSEKPSTGNNNKPNTGNNEKPNTGNNDKPNEEHHHTHQFGGWRSLNDEYEYRECSKDGYKEFRRHGYGAWVYNPATGYEDATCSTCGHVKHRSHTHQFGSWKSLNDEYEYRDCSIDGYRETRAHSYGAWQHNPSTGVDECTCSTCGHVKTQAHIHTHSLTEHRDFYYTDDKCVHIYYTCTDTYCTNPGEIFNESFEGHSYGAVQEKDLGDGMYQQYEVCSKCGHVHYLGIRFARANTHSRIINASVDDFYIVDDKQKVKTLTKNKGVRA